MRLFLALDLEPPLASAVAVWADALDAHLGSAARCLRWTPPAHRHVTLHFLGEVAPARAAALADRLAPGLPDAPFEVSLGGAGLFPPRGRPQVVWLGLQEAKGALRALHATLAAHLRLLELRVDHRPFQAHVTIARVREVADQQLGRRLRDWCAATPSHPASAPVARVTCYESRRSPKGSTYHVLFHVPLIGG